MKCVSTRGLVPAVSFSEAVATGLAPDGGLYVPAQFPDISGKLKEWEKLSYPDLCFQFFRLFADDIEESILKQRVSDSYSRFTHPDIAPLVKLDDNLYVLELFHGPTLAFKDFALQLLGNLYEEQIRRTGEKINVLGATSGDTGAAAIHGLLGKEGVNIFILYPNGRVSPLQERQMVCTGAENVYPLAIEGSFDDAQKALKETFEDQEFRTQHGLSAVNSINLARILAQSVYYLYAWFRLPEEARTQVEFVVPTGNFGNVLAGWLLTRMGMDIPAFRVATNQNDILHRLFTTGIYEVGEVRPSVAPSMDIQVASNFERFLYYFQQEDPEKTREVMATFKQKGYFRFEEFKAEGFSASRTDDQEIPLIIKDIYERYGYIADPHTACGFKDVKEGVTSVVLSTAHPAKFPDTIEKAIGISPTAEALEILKSKKVVKYPMTASQEAIKDFIRQHSE